MSDYTIIVLSLLFSAFFSGMEIAYLSANKLKLELEIKKNGIVPRCLKTITRIPSHYISTILLGNNIALVIYGIFMSKVLIGYINPYLSSEFGVLFTQTAISTIIILFFAEFIPKTLFRTLSNRALTFFAIPLSFFYFTLKPIVRFMIFLSALILGKIFKIKMNPNENDRVFGKTDIAEIVEKGQTKDKKQESNQELKFIRNALDFSNVKLRECIIPRRDIIAVPENTELSDLINVFIESGHSNIPVFKESIDEIVGYINVKDVFKNPQSLKSIIRQVLIVPESMTAKNMLEQLIDENKSLAVVVDEFGGTGGIVTLEDIIEEIFGDIEDEHDNNEFNPKLTKDGNYLFAGRNEVDLINDNFDLKLLEIEDYETIAGYILFHYGSFPAEGEIIEIEDNNIKYRFKILKVQDTKIEKVLMYKQE